MAAAKARASCRNSTAWPAARAAERGAREDADVAEAHRSRSAGGGPRSALPRKGDYPPGVERTLPVDTLLEPERGGVKAAAATAPARVRRDGDVRSARRDEGAPLRRLPDCFDRKLESPKLPWNEEAFCPRWLAYGAEERALRRRSRRRCATRRAARCGWTRA